MDKGETDNNVPVGKKKKMPKGQTPGSKPQSPPVAEEVGDVGVDVFSITDTTTFQ